MVDMKSRMQSEGEGIEKLCAATSSKGTARDLLCSASSHNHPYPSHKPEKPCDNFNSIFAEKESCFQSI